MNGLKLAFIIMVVLAVGPLLVPVLPLKNTVAERELAGPDSMFVDIDELSVHTQVLGEGEEAFVLLHGFGASIFSWREVMEPLAEHGRVIAYDRPAFGLTSRPMNWEGENPYSTQYQVELLFKLMDHYEIDQAYLVGNSAGGTVALLAALEKPERVKGLILVDPAVYETGGRQTWLTSLGKTPQVNHLGPLFVRQIGKSGEETIRRAWYDPTLVTPEVIAGYKIPLQAHNWDRALWKFTLAATKLNLAERLEEVSVPTLVITGDTDTIVPTENSIRLAKELPGASLAVIPQCGHVPQEERPAEFMQILMEFVGGTR